MNLIDILLKEDSVLGEHFSNAAEDDSSSMLAPQPQLVRDHTPVSSSGSATVVSRTSIHSNPPDASYHAPGLPSQPSSSTPPSLLSTRMERKHSQEMVHRNSVAEPTPASERPQLLPQPPLITDLLTTEAQLHPMRPLRTEKSAVEGVPDPMTFSTEDQSPPHHHRHRSHQRFGASNSSRSSSHGAGGGPLPSKGGASAAHSGTYPYPAVVQLDREVPEKMIPPTQDPLANSVKQLIRRHSNSRLNVRHHLGPEDTTTMMPVDEHSVLVLETSPSLESASAPLLIDSQQRNSTSPLSSTALDYSSLDKDVVGNLHSHLGLSMIKRRQTGVGAARRHDNNAMALPHGDHVYVEEWMIQKDKKRRGEGRNESMMEGPNDGELEVDLLNSGRPPGPTSSSGGGNSTARVPRAGDDNTTELNWTSERSPKEGSGSSAADESTHPSLLDLTRKPEDFHVSEAQPQKSRAPGNSQPRDGDGALAPPNRKPAVSPPAGKPRQGSSASRSGSGSRPFDGDEARRPPPKGGRSPQGAASAETESTTHGWSQDSSPECNWGKSFGDPRGLTPSSHPMEPPTPERRTSSGKGSIDPVRHSDKRTAHKPPKKPSKGENSNGGLDRTSAGVCQIGAGGTPSRRSSLEAKQKVLEYLNQNPHDQANKDPITSMNLNSQLIDPEVDPRRFQSRTNATGCEAETTSSTTSRSNQSPVQQQKENHATKNGGKGPKRAKSTSLPAPQEATPFASTDSSSDHHRKALSHGRKRDEHRKESSTLSSAKKDEDSVLRKQRGPGGRETPEGADQGNDPVSTPQRPHRRHSHRSKSGEPPRSRSDKSHSNQEKQGNPAFELKAPLPSSGSSSAPARHSRPGSEHRTTTKQKYSPKEEESSGTGKRDTNDRQREKQRSERHSHSSRQGSHPRQLLSPIASSSSSSAMSVREMSVHRAERLSVSLLHSSSSSSSRSRTPFSRHVDHHPSSRKESGQRRRKPAAESPKPHSRRTSAMTDRPLSAGPPLVLPDRPLVHEAEEKTGRIRDRVARLEQAAKLLLVNEEEDQSHQVSQMQHHVKQLLQDLEEMEYGLGGADNSATDEDGSRSSSSTTLKDLNALRRIAAEIIQQGNESKARRRCEEEGAATATAASSRMAESSSSTTAKGKRAEKHPTSSGSSRPRRERHSATPGAKRRSASLEEIADQKFSSAGRRGSSRNEERHRDPPHTRHRRGSGSGSSSGTHTDEAYENRHQRHTRHSGKEEPYRSRRSTSKREAPHQGGQQHYTEDGRHVDFQEALHPPAGPSASTRGSSRGLHHGDHPHKGSRAPSSGRQGGGGHPLSSEGHPWPRRDSSSQGPHPPHPDPTLYPASPSHWGGMPPGPGYPPLGLWYPPAAGPPQGPGTAILIDGAYYYTPADIILSTAYATPVDLEPLYPVDGQPNALFERYPGDPHPVLLPGSGKQIEDPPSSLRQVLPETDSEALPPTKPTKKPSKKKPETDPDPEPTTLAAPQAYLNTDQLQLLSRLLAAVAPPTAVSSALPEDSLALDWLHHQSDDHLQVLREEVRRLQDIILADPEQPLRRPSYPPSHNRYVSPDGTFAVPTLPLASVPPPTPPKSSNLLQLLQLLLASGGSHTSRSSSSGSYPGTVVPSSRVTLSGAGNRTPHQEYQLRVREILREIQEELKNAQEESQGAWKQLRDQMKQESAMDEDELHRLAKQAANQLTNKRLKPPSTASMTLMSHDPSSGALMNARPASPLSSFVPPPLTPSPVSETPNPSSVRPTSSQNRNTHTPLPPSIADPTNQPPPLHAASLDPPFSESPPAQCALEPDLDGMKGNGQTLFNPHPSAPMIMAQKQPEYVHRGEARRPVLPEMPPELTPTRFHSSMSSPESILPVLPSGGEEALPLTAYYTPAGQTPTLESRPGYGTSLSTVSSSSSSKRPGSSGKHRRRPSSHHRHSTSTKEREGKGKRSKEREGDAGWREAWDQLQQLRQQVHTVSSRVDAVEDVMATQPSASSSTLMPPTARTHSTVAPRNEGQNGVQHSRKSSTSTSRGPPSYRAGSPELNGKKGGPSIKALASQEKEDPRSVSVSSSAICKSSSKPLERTESVGRGNQSATRDGRPDATGAASPPQSITVERVNSQGHILRHSSASWTNADEKPLEEVMEELMPHTEPRSSVSSCGRSRTSSLRHTSDTHHSRDEGPLRNSRSGSLSSAGDALQQKLEEPQMQQRPKKGEKDGMEERDDATAIRQLPRTHRFSSARSAPDQTKRKLKVLQDMLSECQGELATHLQGDSLSSHGEKTRGRSSYGSVHSQKNVEGGAGMETEVCHREVSTERDSRPGSRPYGLGMGMGMKGLGGWQGGGTAGKHAGRPSLLEKSPLRYELFPLPDETVGIGSLDPLHAADTKGDLVRQKHKTASRGSLSPLSADDEVEAAMRQLKILEARRAHLTEMEKNQQKLLEVARKRKRETVSNDQLRWLAKLRTLERDKLEVSLSMDDARKTMIRVREERAAALREADRRKQNATALCQTRRQPLEQRIVEIQKKMTTMTRAAQLQLQQKRVEAAAVESDGDRGQKQLRERTDRVNRQVELFQRQLATQREVEVSPIVEDMRRIQQEISSCCSKLAATQQAARCLQVRTVEDVAREERPYVIEGEKLQQKLSAQMRLVQQLPQDFEGIQHHALEMHQQEQQALLHEMQRLQEELQLVKDKEAREVNSYHPSSGPEQLVGSAETPLGVLNIFSLTSAPLPTSARGYTAEGLHKELLCKQQLLDSKRQLYREEQRRLQVRYTEHLETAERSCAALRRNQTEVQEKLAQVRQRCRVHAMQEEGRLASEMAALERQVESLRAQLAKRQQQLDELLQRYKTAGAELLRRETNERDAIRDESLRARQVTEQMLRRLHEEMKRLEEDQCRDQRLCQDDIQRQEDEIRRTKEDFLRQLRRIDDAALQDVERTRASEELAQMDYTTAEGRLEEITVAMAHCKEQLRRLDQQLKEEERLEEYLLQEQAKSAATLKEQQEKTDRSLLETVAKTREMNDQRQQMETAALPPPLRSSSSLIFGPGPLPPLPPTTGRHSSSREEAMVPLLNTSRHVDVDTSRCDPLLSAGGTEEISIRHPPFSFINTSPLPMLHSFANAPEAAAAVDQAHHPHLTVSGSGALPSGLEGSPVQHSSLDPWSGVTEGSALPGQLGQQEISSLMANGKGAATRHLPDLRERTLTAPMQHSSVHLLQSHSLARENTEIATVIDNDELLARSHSLAVNPSAAHSPGLLRLESEVLRNDPSPSGGESSTHPNWNEEEDIALGACPPSGSTDGSPPTPPLALPLSSRAGRSFAGSSRGGSRTSVRSLKGVPSRVASTVLLHEKVNPLTTSISSSPLGPALSAPSFSESGGGDPSQTRRGIAVLPKEWVIEGGTPEEPSSMCSLPPHLLEGGLDSSLPRSPQPRTPRTAASFSVPLQAMDDTSAGPSLHMQLHMLPPQTAAMATRATNTEPRPSTRSNTSGSAPALRAAYSSPGVNPHAEGVIWVFPPQEPLQPPQPEPPLDDQPVWVPSPDRVEESSSSEEANANTSS